jgi:hypothetical protein
MQREASALDRAHDARRDCRFSGAWRFSDRQSNWTVAANGETSGPFAVKLYFVRTNRPGPDALPLRSLARRAPARTYPRAGRSTRRTNGGAALSSSRSSISNAESVVVSSQEERDRLDVEWLRFASSRWPSPRAARHAASGRRSRQNVAC